MNTYKGDESRIAYYNEKYDFTFTDADDYCYAEISVTVKNKSHMAMHLTHLTVNDKNDIFVFAKASEKAAIMIAPGEADSVSQLFLCRRNGRTDEQLQKLISDNDIRLVNSNKVFGDIELKLSANDIGI